MNRVIRLALKATSRGQKRPSADGMIVNEAVNFEMGVIFVAVPKTGTTSVRLQLKQKGIPLVHNPHLNIAQIKDCLYVYFLKLALGNNKNFPSQSIPTDAEVRRRAETSFSELFKFSAVRNPWARAVSLYYRREGVKIGNKMTFDDFCKNHLYASDTCEHPTLHANQLDWMCGTNGDFLMDYVYKLEEFDLAIAEIEKRTNGRVNLSKMTMNSNRSSLARTYRDVYTEETKKMISKKFERDIDYFKYTF